MNYKGKLTLGQIHKIPTFIEGGFTIKRIAKKYKCHFRTVDYWIKRLRASGIEVPNRKGVKTLKLN